MIQLTNFCKNLQEIDRMILRLQEQGYNTVTKLAVKAFNYASNMVMQTAIRVSNTNLEYLFYLHQFIGNKRAIKALRVS